MKRLIFLMLALLVAGSASAATKVQVMTDGVIDVDRLPTISFFQENDPASPELGQVWWNETTKQLKVADVLGIYEFNATALTAWDTTPEAFSFAPTTDAVRGYEYTSEGATISGINYPAPISVTGGAYSINNATATSANGTVAAGDVVKAKVTSSSAYSTAVNATVTIGGVSALYAVTTLIDPAVVLLIDEDFEGTGTPSGWGKSASYSTFDHASTGLDMGGSQVIRIQQGGWIGYDLASAASSFCAVFRIRSTGSGSGLVRLQSAADARQVDVEIFNGNLRATASSGAVATTAAGAVVDSTKWARVWTYLEGGSRKFTMSYHNGSVWVESEEKAFTSSLDIAKFVLRMDPAQTFYIDDVVLSTSKITQDPQ